MTIERLNQVNDVKVLSVNSPEFAPYGRIVTGYDFSNLIKYMENETSIPENGNVYLASVPEMEADPVKAHMENVLYGGMPIQIGYCNGTNTKLNCVEYHRDSEINIVDEDMVFLVARQQDIVDGHLDTAKVEAFRAPAGTAVELYATTLHYAPCDGVKGGGFRVAVVLPRGTNTDKPALAAGGPNENKLLWARNKWLIAHPDASEAAAGAFVGLDGANPDIADDI
ncbi:MAG: DUF4867 family protein [Butyricicoccus sp.]|nr:DUF4867 family protein [Butyricicoccus sp.]